MAINKVGSKGILDGSVAAADFGAGAITSAKLADGAVTNAKLSNSSITVSGTSVALGASGTLNNQFVDWQSVITGNTTMVAGRGYFVNTTGGAISMTLPASATIGDLVVIKDYAGTFATNKLTILRNSHNIQGVANDSLIDTNRASIVLVYVDSTKGWLYTDEHNVADLQGPTFVNATGGTVTTSGNDKIHSFTGDGNFVVASIGNPGGGPNSVDYLVVAGGAGGAIDRGGGGGAGGYRTSYPSPAGTIAVTAQTYPITVGGGGNGQTSYSANPGAGSNSIFSTITSAGGGAAGNGDSSPGSEPGQAGGSGGGGHGQYNMPGGAGNTPPVSPPQGNAGGNGIPGANYGSGGGGGAGAAGSNGAPGNGGAGGVGLPNSIIGSATFYAGGGGGSVSQQPIGNPRPGGAGGNGGGGAGGTGPGTAGVAGTANTGGGGGGDANAPVNTGGAGGKGIVIIRYKFQ